MFTSAVSKGPALGYTTYIIFLSGRTPVPLPNIRDFRKSLEIGLGFLFFFLPGIGNGSQDLGQAGPVNRH